MEAEFKYPSMVGSPDEVPVGTPEWAMRQGKRLEIAVRHLDQYGIGHLVPEIEKALDADPGPWEVWPEAQPAGTPDRYFQIAAGITAPSLAGLIEAAHPGHDLIPRLRGATARARPARKGAGRPASDTKFSHRLNIAPGSNSSARILARLARDNPEILAEYERGEHKSARAAGKAAGFIKDSTPLDELRKWWKKAAISERAIFLNEVRS